ncbi:hypothetical protein B0T20DRAFT_412034 [Sordaria brevicollis]|uniref:Uncharacterized protein n=1 Tax=Sordaria brevicollis TaxID=83679 RepID=A0AAE0UCV4_SORBR|nr:hypothetical protein B0T20DRAFT_412034 [Sordaria brevicollis]
MMAHIDPEPRHFDTTEEAIHLQGKRDAKSEDPAHPLIRQWSVKDGSDNARIDDNGSKGGGDTLKKRTFRRKLRNWYTNGWLTEILAVILSCSCAAAIPIVLGVYNHDPVPKLPWDVSLNAVVSVLSTVAKSSLLYAICAALGQDKWDWSYNDRAARIGHKTGRQEQEELQQHQEHQQYREDEGLETTGKSSWKTSKGFKDMEMFDQASRGPLGAFKILVSRRTAFSPTSLGALVVLLSLVVDPFTQQVVRLQQRERLVPSDEVWRAQSSAPFFCRTWGYERSPRCVEARVEVFKGAIWLDPEAYKPKSHVTCPSGSCEFENFYAIEYCVDHGVFNNPPGYCDISFNQTELDEAKRHYKETGQHRVTVRSCNHMFDPLITTEEIREVFSLDLVNSSYQLTYKTFGSRDMWDLEADGRDPNWLVDTAMHSAVVTGFTFNREYKFYKDDYDEEYFQYIKYPTETFTYLPVDRTNINGDGSSGVRIPPPRILMGHTRYDQIREGQRATARIRLRANTTEWAALSICQVERTMKVVNGNVSSEVKSSKYLRPAWEDEAEKWAFKHRKKLQNPNEEYAQAWCFAPEDVINDNETMARVLQTEPTGSFPDMEGFDVDRSPRYQADPHSTGAFCLWNGTLKSNLGMMEILIPLVQREVKWTGETGPDLNEAYSRHITRQDLHNYTGLENYEDARSGWEKWWLIPEQELAQYPTGNTQLSVRLIRNTLPAFMNTLAAALNNQNYAMSQEKVTGSYVVRETILVARWEWLTVLFGIEIMGLAYLLYIILRPRSTVGVWKESIFGALYHGLDDETRSSIGHPKNLGDIKEATKYMDVRIDHLKDDGRG